MTSSRFMRVAGVVGGGALVCLLAACAPETRYRVLSFLFDGVPPPPGMEGLAQPPPAEKRRPRYSAFDTQSATRPQIPRPIPATLPIVSVHKPVAENRCKECHDPALDFDSMPAHDARLCDKCHLEQRQQKGWDHGPINLGTCIPCHVSHKSQYPHLLSKPVPDLCLDCHREDLDRPQDYHEVPNVDQCIACHDPHRMY